MSGRIPNNLKRSHQQVKRYNGKNDETFFEELSVYIEEEKIHRQLTLERPGELFFFFKPDYIVVTEELSKIHLTSDQLYPKYKRSSTTEPRSN